jgi:eukaryotic-like serine/threonine-protein kinase
MVDQSGENVMNAALQPVDDPELSGEPFSKYLLVGEIAQGGMGEIFLAVQQGLEGFSKVVVVKRVLRHLTMNPEFTQMFIAEARLAARLEHSNIVKTYEFGEHQGQYFTVMEFLAGEDLGKVLHNLQQREELIALPVAVHIAAQLCNGLHFAHELTDHAGRSLGLVHRDINPANIVITYTGEVKIIDFGVARVDTAAIKTVTGMLKGKFAYMSPEYIQGYGCDHRADVFSVGIVLWEAVTGRQLFARESSTATMYAVMSDPIPLPSKYRPEVPPELDAIIARALARSPADRFATADEMRAALEDFGASLPKVDGRAIGRTMEALFGATRAQAMSSIKQSRSMARNIPLVMKRPVSVPASLSPVGLAPTLAMPAAPRSRRGRGIAVALAAVTVLGVVAVAALVVGRPRSQATSAEVPIARSVAPVVAVAPVPPAHEPVVPIAAPPPVVPPTPPPAGRDAVGAPEGKGDGKVVSHGTGTGTGSGTTASTVRPVVGKSPARRPGAHPSPIVASHEATPAVDAPRPPAAVDAPPAEGTPSGAAPPAQDVAPVPPVVRPVAGTKPVATPPPPAVTQPEPPVPPPAKQPALDVSATRAAVRAQIEPVQQCYERAKMDDGKLRGVVTVRITIAANGSIANAQVASSTLSSPQVEGCITREIARWQLPRPSGGAAVSLSYPFVFD